MREPRPGGMDRRNTGREEVLADEASLAQLRKVTYLRVEDMPQYGDLSWDERAVVVLRAGGANGPDSARRLRFTVRQVNGLLNEGCRRLGFASVVEAAESLRWPAYERHAVHAKPSLRRKADPCSPHLIFRVGELVHKHLAVGAAVTVAEVAAINADMLLTTDGSEWPRRRTHLGSSC